jgi:hypothetical protein
MAIVVLSARIALRAKSLAKRDIKDEVLGHDDA